MKDTTAALYIVATPIGNLADISARAIEVLSSVDVIAAEDTRHSKYLLQHHGIETSTISLHEHNEQQRSELLLSRIAAGESIALISDAGTPLISDPGYRLVNMAREQGIKVIPIPGACAVIAALSASGLSAERFAFEGFLPPKSTARLQALKSLANEPRTLIFYESPKRMVASLQDMLTVFGGDRKACLARELTKMFETIVTLPLAELVDVVINDANHQKGEIVLLVEGQAAVVDSDEAEEVRVLQILLDEVSLKQAAAITASILGIKKNKAYEMALKLQQK
ncbi:MULTISPECIES: 16S rRNA (cytidine(1402)-2'-O)-methyltransferase [unclassified Methylophaga]|uniref:16S rRNA (cytidine(1402)-2'-O)-methyltransferase n=2 Tax=Methylophaga TaxID=40222 RepID=UPI000C43614A|nr:MULTISPECIES: 16S rRNA (cytidine(1402)-2'-O)-methyltransferase [unclassified Methylophaga]MAL50275.1 16S rRNA (cytidine(1402)-2'-O)-methyltransferase [Methylophaga sp.]MAP28260.1 16S rRNA (cytidine(1402)-2'-O)-methyltransferase [Methylophaga sp.]MBP26451.1 16S rRNA (cytidine(1402)-2'-O)-methyltransferase [Methylophaga sp.]HAD30779.1 16S rRNA (cytidine(1402)-2'-O)-methyltransferase [Methylophaga sp.]HCN98933.1 16S rRNA (cytidine(1402)-2'-O)-methyltransferase [Methylophaga sp.]